MAADDRFHSSKKEEADKFKPLITYTTYRCVEVPRASESQRLPQLHRS